MSKARCLAVGFGTLAALLATVSCGGGDGQAVRTVAPGAPGTPMAVSEADSLWEWVAANSLECEPILRPTYLPSTLSRVSLQYVDQQRECVLFGIEYSDNASKATLLIGGGPWFNPAMPGRESVQEQLSIRQTTGTYQLQDAADPVGRSFITWNERGRWGRPEDSWHRDWVPYLITSTGFPKEELLKVANALQPVTG